MRKQTKQSKSWWTGSNRFELGAPQIQRRASVLRGSRRKVSRQVLGQLPAGPGRALPDGEHWKLDEHWVAITAYLAEMDFPNEG